MDEEDYILIENEYYNFKEKLSKDIQNPSISMQNKDCYLIEESWSNQLNNYFDEYHNYKNSNKFKIIQIFQIFFLKMDQYLLIIFPQL